MAVKKLTESQIKELAIIGIDFMSEMNSKHPEAEVRIMAYADGIAIMWQDAYSVAFGVSKYHKPMSEGLVNLHNAFDLNGWKPRFTLPDWAK